MMLSKEIKEKLPFISIVKYGSQEYVGIISNQDQNITIMYVYTTMLDVETKREFLNLGRIWWDESNRMIPIDMFLRGEMTKFADHMITMNTKDVNIIDGPCVNTQLLISKRSKQRTIRLNR